ncbi:hypothetical protein DSL72_005387 [Monilinia vaccinii-corymbosi]|uniref:Ubiquitin-like protease family profile domain-containing protein n=1 Tax=Monilinia vaccinii-corymbosi TaxID=61207 RepID=A0A8A3PFH7_9HELO|nr:hypothetical protein DSL72_005387 [Monilinia vaccinii-corymbosi]
MGSVIKPQATPTSMNFQSENGPRGGSHEELLVNHREITAILDQYSDPARHVVIIDDSNSESDEAAEGTAATQTRALTTKIQTRSRTRALLNYEDVKPLQAISQAFNNDLQPVNHNHHQRTHERCGSEGAQPSCPREKRGFSDKVDIEMVPQQSRLPRVFKMNPQHLSEIDEDDEVTIEKERKREKELIVDGDRLGSNGSIGHIDDLEQAQTKNIQKVSHVEQNIQLSNANNENPVLRHFSDLDTLENHTGATTAIEDIGDTAVDDAPEQGTPDSSKTPNKTEWSFARRYYGYHRSDRTFQVPGVITEPYRKMAKPRGGPTPTNRLSSTKSAAAPPQSLELQPTIPWDGPPYKKQRTEQATSSNGTFRGPNTFGQGASQDQRHVTQIPTQGQCNNSSYQESGYPANGALLGVPEYQAVNEFARHSKRNRNRKPIDRPLGCQGFSNGKSDFRLEQTAIAKRIAEGSHLDDSKDPIEEDELQALYPGLQNSVRVEISSHRNRPQKAPHFLKSQYSKQVSPNYIRKSSKSNGFPREGGSEDELSLDNAPELWHGKQAKKSQGKKNIHNNDSDESDEDEQSLERRGDIPRTDFVNRGKGSQRLQQRHDVPKFGVQSLFSQTRYWHRPDTNKRCFIVQDQSGNLQLVSDSETIPGFFIKADGILSLDIGHESCKLIIHKSRETSPMQDTAMHIEFYSIGVAQDFKKSLEGVLKDIKIARMEKSDINQKFLHTRQVLHPRAAGQAINKRNRAEEQSEDIQLIASNQERRTAQHPQSLKVEDLQSHNGNPPRPKRPKLREQMQGPSTPKNLNGSKGNVDEIEVTEFYETSSKANGTRTSLRSADRSKPYKTVPKERNPSPEHWSEVNRDWENDWHKSVVYPKSGKKTATVDKQDIYRLDNGQFLNDNLIMFYLLWLEQHHPELTKRVYVHNTFFYASLTKTAKGKRGINYEAVERWTARVDLPSYDYIIVPVNENTHWYVVIICNAPRLLDPVTKDESKSMGNGAKPELNGEIEPHDARKPTAPSKSPQPISKRLVNGIDGTEVDNSLRDLSLVNGDETEASLDVEPEESLPPSNHGLPIVSVDVDSGNADTASKSATKVIDLAQSSSPSAKPNSAVRSKKPPPNRNCDPKQPRVITLDSLAVKHSATCANLKDYMVAEIKAKKQISITPTKILVMNAKTQEKDHFTGMYPGTGLPEQGNYCDCGVYLLSYMEEFFERPDSFIEDIIGNKYKVESNRNDAPEFRDKIRRLLLKLQEEQALESEVAQNSKAAKKSKAAPLMTGDNVEPSNPQATSLPVSSRARLQPAFNTCSLNLGRNHVNSTEAASIAPNLLPNSKRKEVISVEDGQENLEEHFEEESASNHLKDANDRAIKDEIKSRGRDRGPLQVSRTTLESGPSEPSVHLEIRDSFKGQESTQESTSRRSMTQQQPKRESSIVDLDGDESPIVEDLPGQDSRGTGNMLDSTLVYFKKTFLRDKKDSSDPAALEDKGSERKSNSKYRKHDASRSLESPSHSGSNSARQLENNTRPRQDAQYISSPSPEQIDSKHSRSGRVGFNGHDCVDLISSAGRKKGNVSQVDLTEDDEDEMLLDRGSPPSSFPDVSTIPPSPRVASSQNRDRSNNHESVKAPIDGKVAESRRWVEDKNIRRFRHTGVEGFANKQLAGRDPAETKMIAQSKD